MYTEFYNLTALPFQLSPDPRFFFESAGHRKAMAYLTYGLNQGEGFIVITGDIGAGKTTLVNQLFATLDTTKYIAATVVTTQLEADDTLRMVAAAFGLDTEVADKATLLRSLEAFFTDVHRSGRRALLMVDEAQNLPMRSLEELRMLSNFQIGEKALLQSFLLGQPQFRPTLAHPDLEQLRQRVIASYHLGPLTPDETRAYVEHRLKRVGWSGDPEITDDAYENLHRHAGGVPRRINAYCSRLFLYGYLEGFHRLDGRAVEQVAEDLESEVTNADARRRTEQEPQPVAPGDDLILRLQALEEHVAAHDRTLRRALAIAADFVERGRT